MSPAVRATSQSWVGGNLAAGVRGAGKQGQGWGWGAGAPWHCSMDTPCFSSQLVAGQRSGAQASVAPASPRVGQRRCSVLALRVIDSCSVAGTGEQSQWLMQKQPYKQITRQPDNNKATSVYMGWGLCPGTQYWSSDTAGGQRGSRKAS